MVNNFIKSTLSQNDTSFLIPLRPNNLNDFAGQKTIKERLEIFIGAAKKRDESLWHIIFSGPPGLGKTTLANIIAKTMGTNLL